MDHSKDRQKVSLLIVFALGVFFTYLAFLFLPFVHTKIEKDRTKMGHKAGGTAQINEADAMKGVMNTMNHDIANENGTEFDKVFLDNMIIHHEGAVSMSEIALKKSKNPDIRALSEEIIEVQKKEIIIMREWKSKLP
jgi:uncharacterized protein (DUF305 family)